MVAEGSVHGLLAPLLSVSSLAHEVSGLLYISFLQDVLPLPRGFERNVTIHS